MDAQSERRRGTGAYHCEGPRMIGKQRIGVGADVVEILILNVCPRERHSALLAELEGRVWRDVITLRTVEGSDRGTVVLAGVGARDVEPRTSHVNRLAEIDGDRCVVWRIETVGDRFRRCDPWTKLHDLRGATRVRRSGLIIVAVLVRILSAVQLSKHSAGVAWCGSTSGAFEAARTCSVTEEIDDVGIDAIRASACE